MTTHEQEQIERLQKQEQRIADLLLQLGERNVDRCIGTDSGYRALREALAAAPSEESATAARRVAAERDALRRQLAECREIAAALGEELGYAEADADWPEAAEDDDLARVSAERDQLREQVRAALGTPDNADVIEHATRLVAERKALQEDYDTAFELLQGEQGALWHAGNKWNDVPWEVIYNICYPTIRYAQPDDIAALRTWFDANKPQEYAE